MDRTWNPTALSITCKDAFFSTRILYTDRPSQLAKHCSNLENNMNCAFEGPVDRFRGAMAEGVVINRSGQGIQQEIFSRTDRVVGFPRISFQNPDGIIWSQFLH